MKKKQTAATTKQNSTNSAPHKVPMSFTSILAVFFSILLGFISTAIFLFFSVQYFHSLSMHGVEVLCFPLFFQIGIVISIAIFSFAYSLFKKHSHTTISFINRLQKLLLLFINLSIVFFLVLYTVPFFAFVNDILYDLPFMLVFLGPFAVIITLCCCRYSLKQEMNKGLNHGRK